MANMHDCIQRAIDARQLNPQRGAAAQNVYQQLVDRYRSSYPLHQAQALASADLKEATRKAARSQYHAVVNQLQAMRRIEAQITAAPDPAVGIRNLVERSPGSGFQGENVRFLAEAYEQTINAEIADVLRETGLNVLGFSRNRTRQLNVIRELHGQSTGDARAVRLADAVRRAQRRMRQMFNAHGGDIGELADFGVPHRHDPATLIRVGFDAWAEAIAPRLAWDRIIDATTGKPFSPSGRPPPRAVADRFLRNVYDGIVTGGWDDRTPMMTPGGRALYNQRAEHRVLHFRSGDDWLEYNRTFGTTDPFTAMVNGLHGLARDVAMMRVLGPNPKAGLEFAEQVALKRAGADARLARRVKSQTALARVMFAHQSGEANVTANLAWASFFAGTRAYLVSANLGSAVVSSISDEGFIAAAAREIGLNPRNVLTREIRLIASSASRENAARMGFVAQTLADAGSGSARYMGRLLGTGILERTANFTIRASGLAFLTDMRRIAFQMELAGALADNAGRAFDDIDPPLRDLLSARGITAADWNQLRGTLYTAPNGATFLTPYHWLEHQTALPRAEAEGLAMRLQMIFQERLERAIPTVSREMQARILGNNPPGTIRGELARSVMAYKSFGLSLTLNQIRQTQARPSPLSMAAYAARISVSLIVLGALALQAKEIMKGNDPRPMTSAKFWLAAALQGGGFGIFGDFFAAETNRFGGGIGDTIAGPVVGLASDVINPVASNAKRALEGKDVLLGRDVSKFLRYNTPVGSSLVYARLAWNRMVVDELQRFLDPEAETQWRQAARRRERDYGTRSWWERGRPLPTRGPDLSNALRSSQ